MSSAVRNTDTLGGKQNKQACDIQCQVCKSTFLKTTKGPAYVHSPPNDTTSQVDRANNNLTSSLAEHAENKHSKTLAECFPTYEQ